MRLPHPPPKENKALAPKKLFELIQAVPGVSSDTRYLHWDELRRRKPPQGLSLDEWWTALDFNRKAQSRQVPLARYGDGEHLRYVITDRMHALLHEADFQGGGIIGASVNALTTPEMRERYLKNSLIEESLTSSLIEGASTTRLQAKEMIRSGRAPSTKSERMILNNYNAMLQIGKYKNRALDLGLIFELHEELTRDTLEQADQAGRFRKSDEVIRVIDNVTGHVLHTPPPAEQLEKRIQALCDFANEKTPDHFVHPVIRAILLHFWLAYDHPFYDGNGRTARALFYWSMLRHGYWLFEFVSISRVILQHLSAYQRAYLYSETGPFDGTYFILNQMDTIQQAIEELKNYIERKRDEVSRVEQQVRVTNNFNDRQLALLAHAVKHPYATYTAYSHQMSHGITPPTARTDLQELVQAGMLTKGKKGHAFTFYPAPDLNSKIPRS